MQKQKHPKAYEFHVMPVPCDPAFMDNIKYLFVALYSMFTIFTNTFANGYENRCIKSFGHVVLPLAMLIDRT